MARVKVEVQVNFIETVELEIPGWKPNIELTREQVAEAYALVRDLLPKNQSLVDVDDYDTHIVEIIRESDVEIPAVAIPRYDPERD